MPATARAGAAAIQGARRTRVSSFDALGAQLYLWAPEASSITLDGSSEVDEWANLGVAGAALDAVRVSGAVTYVPGSHLAVPTGSEFLSRLAATALDVADEGALDVIGVFSSTAPNAQRFLVGGQGQTHFTLIPRWSGLSVFRVLDGVTTLQAVGASLTNDGTIYCQRGRFTGAAAPSNDSSSLKTNDSTGSTASANLGAVSFGADKLAFFSVGGSEFIGNCYALIAKVGGFSAGELAELTTRINAAFGTALAGV
ncbi:MAG: hypothetical protein VYE22_09980 [Myxococcota bacterium]|nr:hypothetical protein [Myxococcota bacterium]